MKFILFFFLQSLMLVGGLSASELTDAASTYSEAFNGYLESELGREEDDRRLKLRACYQACDSNNDTLAKEIRKLGSANLEHRVVEEWIGKNEHGMLSKAAVTDVTLDTFVQAAKDYDEVHGVAKVSKEYLGRQEAHMAYHQIAFKSLEERGLDDLLGELSSAGFRENDVAVGRLRYWVKKRESGV